MSYPLTWPAYSLYEASHVVGPCLLYRAPYIGGGADPAPANMVPMGDLADSLQWAHSVNYGESELMQLYNNLRAHLQKEDFKLTFTVHHLKPSLLQFLMGRPAGRLTTVAPSVALASSTVTVASAFTLSRTTGLFEVTLTPGSIIILGGIMSQALTVVSGAGTATLTVQEDLSAQPPGAKAYSLVTQGSNTIGFGEPSDILNPATNKPKVEPQYASWFLLFPSPEFNFETNPTAEWGALRLFKGAILSHGDIKFARKDECSMQCTLKGFTDLSAPGPDHVAKFYTFIPGA